MDAGEITLLVIGGLIALGVVGWLLLCALIGFGILFEMAADQGFLGLAAFVACWVFFAPVMLVICIIVGALSLWADRG